MKKIYKTPKIRIFVSEPDVLTMSTYAREDTVGFNFDVFKQGY